MDKVEKIELRDEVYEWLRSIGYSATSRAVNRLVTKLLELGYRKPKEKPLFSLGVGGDS